MQDFCVGPFVEGCGTGAGLIIAIGAQNAFVLKQGILKNYVFVTVLMCARIDAFLISMGVGDLERFSRQMRSFSALRNGEGPPFCSTMGSVLFGLFLGQDL